MLAIFLSLFLTAQSSDSKNLVVKVEIPIVNSDLLAARDSSQSRAFESALEQALPTAMDPIERAKRVKTAIRYIKSFRVVEEQRIGETLQMTYEVELQDTAFEGIGIAAVPEAVIASNELGGPLAIEIVFIAPMNAAEVVDHIKTQLKIEVESFKLTRSAILLSIITNRTSDEIIREIQTYVGPRARVNVIDKALGLPSGGNLLSPIPILPPMPALPPPSLPSVTPELQQAPSVIPEPSPAPMPAPVPTPKAVVPVIPAPPAKKTFSSPSFKWAPPPPSPLDSVAPNSLGTP